MFVCKMIGAKHMVYLFGEQQKTIEGKHKIDIFCDVIESTISFKYVKARMTLYICFSYNCWMKNCWVPLQAEVFYLFKSALHYPMVIWRL